MASIEFVWDSRDLKVWRDGNVDKALRTALKKAGGDAIRALKSASTKRVRERKRMKAGKVNRGLPLTFPKGNAINSLAWRMDVSGDAVPVSEYPIRQTSKGVSVEINKGARKVIKSAFVATMSNGHKGVFTRRGKNRLPIDEAFTTKLTDVFEDKGMIPAVQERAQEVFRSSFERLFALELKK